MRATTTIFAALFALAGCAQAIGPASAAAMIDTGTGSECVSFGIPGIPWFGWNGKEVCEITNGSGGGESGGGDGGQGSGGGGSGGGGGGAVSGGGEQPPTVPSSEPVVEIHDPVTPPACPPECLEPQPPRGSGDGDLLGQAPPRGGGGSPGKVKSQEEKEKEIKRLKECRRVFGESKGWLDAWHDMARDWEALKAELATQGLDPSDPEARDYVQNLESRFRILRTRISWGILNWKDDDCGPVPLKWKALQTLVGRGLPD
jgi:hypothetical protein